MELQSTEQMTFQRREWTVQKIGTVVLVAFVLAGLLGLFGVGPLASTTQSSPEGLVEVEYDRVTRSNTDDQITLTFSPEAVENGTITFELTGGWLSAVDLQGITPEPADQQAIPNGTAMTLEAETNAEVEVDVSLIAREHLMHDGQVTVNGDTVSFNQFVLP